MVNNEYVVGNKYSCLTILGFSDNTFTSDGRRIQNVICVCECGNTVIKRLNLILGGVIRCCGCRIKSLLHGIYFNIKARCYNPKVIAFKDYGGRGIKLCAK